jgi:diguanylate cyclase (GGDEF)-like protein
MSNGASQSKEVLSVPRPAEEGELARAQEQLKRLELLFNVALDNMARGLAMFDADQRLILCNKRCAEIYGLPEELTRPGTPFASIARFIAMEEDGRDDAEEAERQSTLIESHVSKLTGGETVSLTQHLRGGRAVHVTSHPLTGGGWVEIQEYEAERREGEQAIQWLAHNDPLTEVANPLYFGEELENALRQLKRGIAFALHWIDLDRFAEVNEKYGHPIGDAVLRNVAERLVRCVRRHDLVARLGGDEFAIIQAGVKTQAQAERLTKRLLRAISKPYHVLGHEIPITASIGVALAPEHGTSSLELMKNVYLALYAAKAAGRDTHAVFEADLPNKPHEVVAGPTNAPTNG